MKMTLEEFRDLGYKLFKNPDERMRFLIDARDAAENRGTSAEVPGRPGGLATSLSAHDLERVGRAVVKIIVQSEQGDHRFRVQLGIIFADADFGIDEELTRKWKPRSGGSLDNQADVYDCINEIAAMELFGNREVPGAVVSIVKRDADGKTWHTWKRPYGCAEFQRSRVTENTLFRVGSISKLITATAVLQLCEKGRLDLKTNVNDYLRGTGSEIPSEGFTGEITLEHLLTHTAGFEENQIGAAKKRWNELVALQETIAEHRPSRVREPSICGTDASYSSWGFCLAGHVVALKSPLQSKSFDDYVEDRIFKCLGMTSTFREPHGGLTGDVAKGHLKKLNDRAWLTPVLPDTWLAPPYPPVACPPTNEAIFEPQDWEYLSSLGPAASLSASAADMAKFMIAHLNDGQSEDGKCQLLQPETVARMQSRVVDPHSSINGGCLAFHEMWMNGRRVLCHRGVTIYSNAMLMLLPDEPEPAGLFVAVNAGGATSNGLIHWFVKDFMDAYYANPTSTSSQNGRDQATPDSCSGTYISNTHSYRKNEKILLMRLGTCKVAPAPGSTSATHRRNPSLQIDAIGWKDWDDAGQDVFQQHGEGGKDFIAFMRDEKGEASHIVGPRPFQPFYKPAWYHVPQLHTWLLCGIGISLLAFLLLIGKSIAYEPHAAASPNAIVRWLAVTVSVLDLTMLIALWQTLRGDVGQLAFGYPPIFRVGLRAVIGSLVFSAIFVVALILAFAALNGFERIIYLLFLIPLVGFLLSMHYWNLIGNKSAW